jgi:UDP-3-O-[3-hydroxymyristoyl] glucosamine N-acyltransferase
MRDGRHMPSPQLGNVVLHDDVEIGAATTIDRGTYGSTVIGEGTKIDNQVMIGHNCRIGKHNLLCANVGIAGSCTTGDYVVMAGQVGLRDHVDIASGVMIGAKSGVSESLTESGKYLGSPAVPLRQEIQCLMARQKLPELRKMFKRLQREISDLQTREDDPGKDRSAAA